MRKQLTLYVECCHKPKKKDKTILSLIILPMVLTPLLEKHIFHLAFLQQHHKVHK